MFKYVLFFLFGGSIFAQTVSTYFSDPAADVDDSMIFNANGDLFGSNFNGDTVYKITSGTATPFITGLMNPNGLALDAAENLFVCEYSAQQIKKYDSGGTFLESYPIGGFPSGLIRSFDGDAMIFTNVSNNSVNRLDAGGIITEMFQGSPLNAPVGLAYDETGNLYVGNFVGHEIYKLDGATAQYIATVPNGGASGGNEALGFITYANGKLYGTNFGGHQIYAVNPLGVDDFVLFSGGIEGSNDGPVATATFSFPNGIIFNASENALYISEFSGVGNIRRIDDVPLGTSQFNSAIALSLSPNPAGSFINLKTETNLLSGSVTLDIFDVMGRLVESLKTESRLDTSSLTVDVSKLSAGVYLLKLADLNNLSVTKKFIKSN